MTPPKGPETFSRASERYLRHNLSRSGCSHDEALKTEMAGKPAVAPHPQLRRIAAALVLLFVSELCVGCTARKVDTPLVMRSEDGEVPPPRLMQRMQDIKHALAN